MDELMSSDDKVGSDDAAIVEIEEEMRENEESSDWAESEVKL